MYTNKFFVEGKKNTNRQVDKNMGIVCRTDHKTGGWMDLHCDGQTDELLNEEQTGSGSDRLNPSQFDHAVECLYNENCP